MNKKGILILTPFFSPNIGGVETHIDDLVFCLSRMEYRVYVHTYSPLTTPNTHWHSFEKKGDNVEIRRYRWFGGNIFNFVERFPILDFMYLTPYLLVRTFFWMIFNGKKVDTIHAHGFNAALIAVIIKFVFKKRVIVSTHTVYEINKNSLTAKMIRLVLDGADKILCLSSGSYKELISFGLDRDKLDFYKNWVNLDVFFESDKSKSRMDLGIEDKFSILFVGRMIRKKGVRELVSVAKQLQDMNFIFIGTGPESEYLRGAAKEFKNINFIGKIDNSELGRYYSVADVFCVPSQEIEGTPRTIMEAISCGVPVVAANKGGIPDILDDSVSIVLDPTTDNIKDSIRNLYSDHSLYDKLASRCRSYAKRNFSDNNLELIIKWY